MLKETVSHQAGNNDTEGVDSMGYVNDFGQMPFHKPYTSFPLLWQVYWISLTQIFGYFLLGVTGKSAVDEVETSKPVLKMALCSSFNDTNKEQKK